MIFAFLISQLWSLLCRSPVVGKPFYQSPFFTALRETKIASVMSPVSPAQNGFNVSPKKTITERSEVARSKWKILAAAISRKSGPDNKNESGEVPLRFPSYEVIKAEPVPASGDDDKSLLWFEVSLPEFSISRLQVTFLWRYKIIMNKIVPLKSPKSPSNFRPTLKYSKLT